MSTETDIAELVAAVRDTAHEFLAAEFPIARMKATVETPGFPRALWTQMAELGWPQLLQRNAARERDFGPREFGVLCEETGAALVPGPLLETVLVWGLPTEVFADLAEDAVLSFAHVESDSRGMPGFAGTRLTDGRLTGVKTLVNYAADADQLVVTALDASGSPILVTVTPGDEGVTIVPETGYDLVSSPARVEFMGAPARIAIDGAAAVAAMEEIELLALIGMTSRALGVMRTVLALSVQYAKDRVQFGRPIGSFQAVAHRLADMATAVETTAVCVRHAIDTLEGSDAQAAAKAARVAKGYCARALRTVMESGLQVHAGIGFTEEYDLHLFFKHGLALRGLWGNEDVHADWLGQARLETIDP